MQPSRLVFAIPTDHTISALCFVKQCIHIPTPDNPTTRRAAQHRGVRTGAYRKDAFISAVHFLLGIHSLKTNRVHRARHPRSRAHVFLHTNIHGLQGTSVCLRPRLPFPRDVAGAICGARPSPQRCLGSDRNETPGFAIRHDPPSPGGPAMRHENKRFRSRQASAGADGSSRRHRPERPSPSFRYATTMKETRSRRLRQKRRDVSPPRRETSGTSNHRNRPSRVGQATDT